MTKTSPLRRRESLTRLGVDKAIYSASEKISQLLYSSAFPQYSREGYIDLWELESIVSAILTEAINEITAVDPATGEAFSFEIKNRSSLIDDMVTLILECIRDAFGSSVEIDYPTPRIISVRPVFNICKRDFIQKEFKITIYEVLARLLRK